jgi:hypothetical protein
MGMHFHTLGCPIVWGCIPKYWGTLVHRDAFQDTGVASARPFHRPGPHPTQLPHPIPPHLFPFTLAQSTNSATPTQPSCCNASHVPSPAPLLMDSIGTWVPVDSMDTHRFHGDPWIPWVPIELLSAHGFHGHPWIPWVPTDPWILMNAMGTYEFQGYRWNRRIPTHSMGTRGFHGHPWHYCVPMDSMGTYGFQGYRWILRIRMNSIGIHGFHEYLWHS